MSEFLRKMAIVNSIHHEGRASNRRENTRLGNQVNAVPSFTFLKLTYHGQPEGTTPEEAKSFELPKHWQILSGI
jgi:hypothetical protein